jgi:hypothetical protein
MRCGNISTQIPINRREKAEDLAMAAVDLILKLLQFRQFHAANLAKTTAILCRFGGSLG